MKEPQAKRVGILVGGRSPESGVSIRGAANIVRLVGANGYEPVLIGIDPSGRWFLQDWSTFGPAQVGLETDVEVSLVPGSGEIFHSGRRLRLDAVFPALHGPYGEDGAGPGLLRMAGLPFVGEDVLASAACMDKEFTKRLLEAAGLPIPSSRIVRAGELPLDAGSIVDELGPRLFVKPCNAGSSLGVSLVTGEDTLEEAVEEALGYDVKVIIEESIQPCREITCALLGRPTRVSVPGEVVVNGEFYSYEDKSSGVSSPVPIPGLSTKLGQAAQDLAVGTFGSLKSITHTKVPAALPDPLRRQVADLAIAVFEALGCDTMARVDLFLDGEEKLLVNEINTMPAFNTHSIFPRLWEVNGLPQKELVGELIELAFSRFDAQEALRREAPES